MGFLSDLTQDELLALLQHLRDQSTLSNSLAAIPAKIEHALQHFSQPGIYSWSTTSEIPPRHRYPTPATPSPRDRSADQDTDPRAQSAEPRAQVLRSQLLIGSRSPSNGTNAYEVSSLESPMRRASPDGHPSPPQNRPPQNRPPQNLADGSGTSSATTTCPSIGSIPMRQASPDGHPRPPQNRPPQNRPPQNLADGSGTSSATTTCPSIGSISSFSSQPSSQESPNLGLWILEDVDMIGAVNGEDQSDLDGNTGGRGKLSRDKGHDPHTSAGQKAKEGVLGRKGRKTRAGGGGNPASASCKRGARKQPQSSKSTSKQVSDPQLSEKRFEPARNLPEDASSENQVLSEEAHLLVVELCQLCHKFLHDPPDDNQSHPIQTVIQLLELGSSSVDLEAAMVARLKIAFARDSLETFAMRCNIANENMALNSFSFMLNAIQLRCAVVSECHKKGLTKRTVLNRIQYSGRCTETLSRYVLDGAKFCLLAGGGESSKTAQVEVLTEIAMEATVYILAFLASSKLQSRIRNLTHDVILRIYYLLRSPNPDHPLGRLVIQDIIPAIAAVRKRCRIKFSTMFSETLLVERGLIPFVDAGDVTLSDEFFDRITFNAFLKPRHLGHWNPCFIGEGLPVTISPFYLVDQTMLAANSISFLSRSRTELSSQTHSDPSSEPGSPLTDFSTSESEPEEMPASSAPAIAKTFIVNTHFDPNMKENKVPDFSCRTSSNCQKDSDCGEDSVYQYTERERERAEKGETPKSLEELKEKFQDLLAEGAKKSPSYVYVTQDCLAGTRLRINDKDGNIILYCFPDLPLPQEKRMRLLDQLKSAFPEKIKFVDSAKEGAGYSFDAFHMDFWNIYATQGGQYPTYVEPSVSLQNKGSGKGSSHTSSCMPRASQEIQSHAEKYRILSECFADIFNWIRQVLKECLPEDYELLGIYASVLPADGFSPVFPFSGFVININACTKIHRDTRDLKLCLVMALSGNGCVGGDLCLKEAGVRLQLRCGDMVIFPSDKFSHFNTHFRGERVSLVFHTDLSGEVWVEHRNHWKENVYMHVRQAS